MASKNQTPAPKVSGDSDHGTRGKRKEPAVEHLESGYYQGISPEMKDEGQLAAKTTMQQQEEQAEKSSHGEKSLEIPYGMEGEGKKKSNDDNT